MGRLLAVVLLVAGCHGVDTAPQSEAGDPVPPAPAALSITPPMLELGSVIVGDTTTATTFTVANTGGSTSGSIFAIATGVDAAAFNVSSNCTTLAPTAACSVNVIFTASGQGAKSASVVISATPGGTVMSSLHATVVSQPPLEISPTGGSFSDQAVNTTSATALVFTVTNPSGIATGALVVTGAGTDLTQFVKSADTCSGAPLTPSTSCTFTIAFHPTTTGPKSASFAVSATPGGSVSVGVSGTGI